MQAYNMTNDYGHKSANNIIIQDNKENTYLQSYNEIVAIKHEGIVYVNKEALTRSSTTNRYMQSFIKRFGQGESVEMEEGDFLDMSKKL